MFPGGSEIIISVIVKHVQHVGIIRVFCLPVVTYYNFQYLGDRKIAGLWFTRGGSNLFPNSVLQRIKMIRDPTS